MSMLYYVAYGPIHWPHCVSVDADRCTDSRCFASTLWTSGQSVSRLVARCLFACHGASDKHHKSPRPWNITDFWNSWGIGSGTNSMYIISATTTGQVLPFDDTPFTTGNHVRSSHKPINTRAVWLAVLPFRHRYFIIFPSGIWLDNVSVRR